MLQSLSPVFFLEREIPKVSISDREAELDLIACSEHVEDFSPLLYEVLVIERELSPDEADEADQSRRSPSGPTIS